MSSLNSFFLFLSGFTDLTTWLPALSPFTLIYPHELLRSQADQLSKISVGYDTIYYPVVKIETKFFKLIGASFIFSVDYPCRTMFHRANLYG